MRRGIATLQRLRDLRERQALAALAVADRDVRDASDRLASERDRHAAEAERLDVTTTAALVAARLRGAASLEVVQRAGAAVTEAEDQRDQRAQARTHAAVERRSLDRLVERLHERDRAEAQHAAQRAADELATQRWEGA